MRIISILLLVLALFTQTGFVFAHSDHDSHDDNHTTSSHEESSHGDGHDETPWADTWDEMFWIDFSLLSCIALLGWAFTFGMEKLEEHLSGHDDDENHFVHNPNYFQLEVIYSFQKEITTLGFIGGLTYALHSWDFFASIIGEDGEREADGKYGPTTEHQLFEAVEILHYILFLSLLAFLVWSYIFCYFVKREYFRMEAFEKDDNEAKPENERLRNLDKIMLKWIKEVHPEIYEDINAHWKKIDPTCDLRTTIPYFRAKLVEFTHVFIEYTNLTWAFICITYATMAVVFSQVEESEEGLGSVEGIFIVYILSQLIMYGFFFFCVIKFRNLVWLKNPAEKEQHWINDDWAISLFQYFQFHNNFFAVYCFWKGGNNSEINDHNPELASLGNWRWPIFGLWLLSIVILPYLAANDFVFAMSAPPFVDAQDLRVLKEVLTEKHYDKDHDGNIAVRVGKKMVRA